MDFFSPESLTALLGVTVVNLVLSGDNAVVIGMAAHKLHGRQRSLAILFGGVAAVVLRIVFTAAAAYLMNVPLLQFIGGLMLVWIAYKLLIEDTGEGGHKEASSLLQAIWIITVADVVMSLDNILAIAAMTKDSMAILIVGLVLSMAIVLFAGSIVAVLMERYPWINYIGSIAIAYVAGEMLLKDQAIQSVTPAVMRSLENASASIEVPIMPLVLAIAIPIFATWQSKRRAASREEFAIARTSINKEA